jgi:hypothetical protein
MPSWASQPALHQHGDVCAVPVRAPATAATAGQGQGPSEVTCRRYQVVATA